MKLKLSRDVSISDEKEIERYMHILQFWTHGDNTHTWEIALGMDENHNLSWNQYENRHSKLLTDIFFVELFSWKVQGKWLKLFNELYLVWAPKRASKNQRYFFTIFSVQLLKCLPSSGPHLAIKLTKHNKVHVWLWLEPSEVSSTPTYRWCASYL